MSGPPRLQVAVGFKRCHQDVSASTTPIERRSWFQTQMQLCWCLTSHERVCVLASRCVGFVFFVFFLFQTLFLRSRGSHSDQSEEGEGTGREMFLVKLQAAATV